MKTTFLSFAVLAHLLASCGKEKNNQTNKETHKLILGTWQSVVDSTHILIFEAGSHYEGRYTETKQGKVSPNTHYECHGCDGFSEELEGNRNLCLYLSPKANANGSLYFLDVLTENEMAYTDRGKTTHKFRKIKTKR